MAYLTLGGGERLTPYPLFLLWRFFGVGAFGNEAGSLVDENERTDPGAPLAGTVVVYLFMSALPDLSGLRS